MRIEEITKGSLVGNDKNTLYALRLRCNQIWSKHFGDNNVMKSGAHDRGDLITKYALIIDEMNSQKIAINNPLPLDKVLLKSRLFKLNVPAMGDFVLSKNFISADGKFVDSPLDAEHVSVCVKAPEDFFKAFFNINGFITAIVESQCNKGIVTKFDTSGPKTAHIPMFDLVLRSKVRTEKVDFQEDASEIKPNPFEWDDQKLTAVLAVIAKISGGSVADLGCGDGRFGEMMFKQGLACTCFDNDEHALNLAKERGLGVKKANLEVPLSEEDNSIDTVVSIDVIGELEDPTTMLSESIRIAKKQAIFVLSGTKEEVGSMFMKCISEGIPEGRQIEDYGCKVSRIQESNRFLVTLDVEQITKNWANAPETKVIIEKDPDKNVEIVKFMKTFKDKSIPFFINKVHSKKDERIVTGVVYAPNVTDSQGDYTTEEEIVKAAHSFMEASQTFGLQHEEGSMVCAWGNTGKTPIGKVLESYVAPADFKILCSDGQVVQIAKGTWVLTTRVTDNNVWDGIQDGSITGYSMGGFATKE